MYKHVFMNIHVYMHMLMLTHDHGYMQMGICACMHMSIYAREGCVHACAYVHMSYHLHFCMCTCGYNGMRMCV